MEISGANKGSRKARLESGMIYRQERRHESFWLSIANCLASLGGAAAARRRSGFVHGIYSGVTNFVYFRNRKKFLVSENAENSLSSTMNQLRPGPLLLGAK